MFMRNTYVDLPDFEPICPIISQTAPPAKFVTKNYLMRIKFCEYFALLRTIRGPVWDEWWVGPVAHPPPLDPLLMYRVAQS